MRPYRRGDRREASRGGVGRRAMDALYGIIRWAGGHMRGFHAAVGLYLTVGFALALLGLALFATLARLVGGGALHAADTRVLLWLHQHTSPVGDALALAGAALGSGTALWIALLGGSAYFIRSRHLYSLVLLWVALLGGRMLDRVLKLTFERPRPHLFGSEIELLGWHVEYPQSYSFPSGHALTSMVIYGTLAYLVARTEPTRRMRRWTLIGAATLILGIGLSRLYLAVHYPSDVLAGYLAGFAWATFSAYGIEAVRYFRGRRPGVGLAEADLGSGMSPVREALREEST